MGLSLIILFSFPKKTETTKSAERSRLKKATQRASDEKINTNLNKKKPLQIQGNTSDLSEHDQILENYLKLTNQTTVDYITVYSRIMERPSDLLYDQIMSDLEANGFPRVPDITLKSYGILDHAYMALAACIQDDKQLERIYKLIKNGLPDLITQNGLNNESNINEALLVGKLGICKNPKIFEILRFVHSRNQSLSSGVATSVFWYDYATKHYKEYYFNAKDPLQPFYDPDYFKTLKIPMPSIYSNYRRWAKLLISTEASEFLKSIDYDYPNINLK